MNEKLQYATMLEIPVSTCSVVSKPLKKKRVRRKKEVNPESVKQQLFSKINAESESPIVEEKKFFGQEEYEGALNELKVEEQEMESAQISTEVDDIKQNDLESAKVYSNGDKKRKRFKFSVIGVQFAVIGVLALTILLTSIINTDSGINTFFKSVFKSEPVQTIDERIYSDFAPVIAMNDDGTALIENGVITLGGKGSIYAPCDGTVSNITLGEDGKYTIEITHSENFKSLISGIEYAYAGLEDSVYHNIPVGYVSEEGVTMCFTGADGSVISDYTIVDNAVVWAV